MTLFNITFPPQKCLKKNAKHSTSLFTGNFKNIHLNKLIILKLSVSKIRKTTCYVTETILRQAGQIIL